jgi:parvulin-like peptidyl-prolyl isomerase
MFSSKLASDPQRLTLALLIALAAASAGAACRSTPPAPPPVSADTWATVDGREIKREQVETAFRRVRDMSQTLSDEETLTAKLNLLNDVIMEELLIARAATLKIEVPESELDKAYNEAKSNIPEEQFQQELTRRNVTAADMREGLRRQLLTQKVLDQEVGTKVTVTDQEISDFYTANRPQFNLAEDAYHLAQIVITPERDQQVVNRTGDDATTPQAATQKAAMLMEKLKGGATFRDLAMDYSEDPESTPRGGDLGFVPLSGLNQAPPPLRDAVFKIAPGQARVVSQNGMHTIVYLVAKETAGQRELTTPGVRERITETLRDRRDQLLRTAYLTTLRGDATVVNHEARRVVEAQGKVPRP